MRNLLYTTAIAAVISLPLAVAGATQAMALGDCNGHSCNTVNDNDTYNKGGEGGTGIGVGIGIGQGGDASAHAGAAAAAISGSSSSVKNYNQDTNINHVSNSNKNYNSDFNANTNVNGAVSKGNTTSTTVKVEGDRIEAEPAIAPNVTLTSANCIGSISGSGAGGGVISIGLGGTFQYEDCLKNEVAKTFISMGMNKEARDLLLSVGFVNEALVQKDADTGVRTTPAMYQRVAYEATGQSGDPVSWAAPRLTEDQFTQGATVFAGPD